MNQKRKSFFFFNFKKLKYQKENYVGRNGGEEGEGKRRRRKRERRHNNYYREREREEEEEKLEE